MKCVEFQKRHCGIKNGKELESQKFLQKVVTFNFTVIKYYRRLEVFAQTQITRLNLKLLRTAPG